MLRCSRDRQRRSGCRTVGASSDSVTSISERAIFRRSIQGRNSLGISSASTENSNSIALMRQPACAAPPDPNAGRSAGAPEVPVHTRSIASSANPATVWRRPRGRGRISQLRHAHRRSRCRSPRHLRGPVPTPRFAACRGSVGILDCRRSAAGRRPAAAMTHPPILPIERLVPPDRS